MTAPTGATPADADPATGTGDDTTLDTADRDLLADTTDPGDDDPDGTDQLGDAGKQALARMKERWRGERDQRKALEAKLAAQQKPPAAAAAGDKPDDKPDLDAVRNQAKAEAAAEMLRERALDKIETRAARKFADPEDARLQLAGQAEDFIDNGKLDTDAIDEALDELLKKKPHLAAQGGRRFGGGADGGARKGSTKPEQLTENDLKRMTPQQIEEARLAGRFNELLGAS